MRVLCVEHGVAGGESASQWLQRHAPQVELETVHTLAAALAKLGGGQLKWDIVLTGLHLPDGDGLALVRAVRARSPGLAVVVMGEPASEPGIAGALKVAALKAGANEYVIKSEDGLESLRLRLESARPPVPEDASRRNGQIRALLVGHDPSDITPITHHLSQHARHIHIEVITSGSDALTRVSNGASGNYDVCLLDHPMPAYPGLELLEQLVQHALPVVLLARGDDNEVIGSGLRLGAAGHVIKKAGYLEGLPAALERACGRREKEPIVEPAPPRPLSQYQAAREHHAAAILRALPDLLLVQTCEGVYLDYYGSDLLLAPGDIVGRNMRNVLPPALADRFLECFRKTAESGEPQVMEFAHSRKGEERFYEARVVSAGTGRMLTIVREITERKRVEGALGEGRARIPELAARLIAAQEQDERARIANELLDAAANLTAFVQ